jgi:signal transduction histidine kinase
VEEAGRVDRIVGSLLSLSRRGALGPWSGGSAGLDALFDDLVLLTSARAAQAGVSVQAEKSGIIAPAPREALAQALLNLLLNAIAHTPGGGVVTMSAEAGERVVVQVRDTGPGVPAEERERIFEPFHTASVDGTGLGLSVVRRIARELDWRLTVVDAPGGGAEFRIGIEPSRRRSWS